MMGFALEHDEFPITKSTNCIIAADAEEVRGDAPEWACIRCGECAIACPARLLPQDLLLAARAQDNPLLASLSLTECIECGCCDVVCPSHVPLTETFRRAKPAYRQYEQELLFNDAADERYQSRASRLTESRQAEEQQRTALKQSLEQERGLEIRAAVERARRRRTDTPADDS
jgi:electron transport complex protein RnfC